MRNQIPQVSQLMAVETVMVCHFKAAGTMFRVKKQILRILRLDFL